MALLLGCSGPPPASGRPSAAPSAAEPRTAPRRTRWARFEEVAGWPAANDQPVPSRGHGAGQYELEVRLDPSLVGLYRSQGGRAELPNGALVAAFHRDVRRGQPGPVYVMQKTAAGWSYQAYEADGLSAEHGVLSLCERCHLESPAGGLFGLPTPLAPRD